MRRLAGWYIAFAGVAWPQPGLPSLADIKQKILTAARGLPNYTCTETMEQSQRLAREKTLEMTERFRLNVAYVGGKEVVAWLGGEALTEEDVSRLIGGAVANGDFALLMHSLFLYPEVGFSDALQEFRNGRRMMRYNYVVPVEASNMRLSVAGHEAIVGYHGTFWVDRDQFDLLELDATLDNIPRAFGLKKVERQLQYARISVGASEFLLPQHAVMIVTWRNNDINQNEVLFQGCRQYVAESMVRFDASDPTAEVSSASGAKPAIPLPEEFEAELTLDTDIDSDTAAVGDPVTARLQEGIRRDGEIAIPKDAVLHGRISRLPLIDGHRYIDFRFRYFDWNGTRVGIVGRSNEPAFHDELLFKGLARVPTPIPGQGGRVRLPVGYRLFLKSTVAR